MAAEKLFTYIIYGPKSTDMQLPEKFNTFIYEMKYSVSRIEIYFRVTDMLGVLGNNVIMNS